MNALLLGGMSQRNQDWIHQVNDVLKPLFDKTVVHDYAHWSSGGQFNFESEQQAIAVKAQELGDNYLVFAKSIGAVLTIKLTADGLLKPKKCILAGTALAAVKSMNLNLPGWLNKVACPILFIHNTDDPVGGFAELEKYIKKYGHSHYQFVEWPGDTHDYENLTELYNLVMGFMAQ